MRTKTLATEVALNATKDDDDLLEKKSVIFCWLTEVSLIVHSGKQPKRIRHIISFGADKNRGNWGRIQRDERWWWPTWKEECHLLLTHWSYFNDPFGKATKRTKHIITFGADNNLGNWARIQRDKSWWWSTWKEECHLSLTHWSYFNGPFGKATKRTKHIISFGADKNLGNWCRIQRDERWPWSTWKEECHLLLTRWSHFNRPLRKATEKNQTHH